MLCARLCLYFVVNELVERLNLLLLIVVLGRRVGQVKAGILEPPSGRGIWALIGA